MQIAQVNYQDKLGGAERIAFEIHNGLRKQGHDAVLYVGKKNTDASSIKELNPDTGNNLWTQCWVNQASKLEARQRSLLTHYGSKLLRALARPDAFYRWWHGQEEFGFHKTGQLLTASARSQQLLHLHNLHGGYFDLRLLPQLCATRPVTITLHDEWMYTGHCGYSAGCSRWQHSCGECPDLTSYPAIRVDNTRQNRKQKQELYQRSRFFLTTPSQWLLDRAKDSILSQSIINCRVINNGVNTELFKPAITASVRRQLGIDEQAFVGLFVANHFRTSKAKDYNTVYEAMHKLAAANKNKDIVLLAIGEDLGTESHDNLQVKTLPFISDQQQLGYYYQSADIYLHAAFTEIWGLTITEAMACGIPVVATKTGGIPEQVCSLAGYDDFTGYDKADATGILVNQQDSEQMYLAVNQLMNDRQLARQLGDNAATVAALRFSHKVMLQQYIDWYQEILAQQSYAETLN